MSGLEKVTVSTQRYTIVFEGEILPEAELTVEHDFPYTFRPRASANAGITYEYGEWSAHPELLEIADEDRDFSLPGEVGEFAGAHINAIYPVEQDHRREASGLHMSHLHVDDAYRGQGLGAFLFDIYRAVAVYIGEDATGKIGGGENTVEFLTHQGIPRRDIQTPRRVAPGVFSPEWATDAQQLKSGPPRVAVK